MLVLAPARIGFLDRWASDVEAARREAQRRLVITRRRAGQGGVEAEARVGDEDLVQAVEDQLGSFAATEVILVSADGDEDPAGEPQPLSELRSRLRPGFALRGQRSSSSLKRSAARVGAMNCRGSVQQADGAEVADRALDRVALGEPGAVAAQLADQFGQGQPGRVEVEHLLQHRGLGGGVFGQRLTSLRCRRLVLLPGR